MVNTKENPLGKEKINVLLRKFAIPSIVAMLVSSLYNIVDQIFIGRSVGMLGNAATNVALPLSTICIAISLLCGIGGAANFNLSMGRGDQERAKKYAGNTISLSILLGILLCIIVIVFLEPLMRAFGATNEVLDYAMIYTHITSFGFPFLILTTSGSNLIRADGSPTYSMLCTLSGAIINTILDPILIFGFDLGMQGAALATIIGQFVSAMMVVKYLCNYKTVKLSIYSLKLSLKHCIKIVALGATPGLNQLAMMVVQVVLNNILIHYGAKSSYGSEIPLAVSGIISKVNMIYFAFVIGISQGIQPISSFNYGAKKYDRVEEVYKKAVFVATIISTIAFLAFQLFPRQIISIFGSGSNEYFRFAQRYFHIFLFFTFVNGIQPISSTFFTTIGKPVKGIFLSLTRQIIFLLPLILLLPLLFGIDGVMFAAPIADFIAAALSIIFVRSEFKKFKLLSSN